MHHGPFGRLGGYGTTCAPTGEGGGGVCVCGGGGSSEELLMACAVFIRSSSGFFGGGGGTIGAVVGAAFHQAVGAVGRFCSSGYRLGWFGDGSIDWG